MKVKAKMSDYFDKSHKTEIDIGNNSEFPSLMGGLPKAQEKKAERSKQPEDLSVWKKDPFAAKVG